MLGLTFCAAALVLWSALHAPCRLEGPVRERNVSNRPMHWSGSHCWLYALKHDRSRTHRLCGSHLIRWQHAVVCTTAHTIANKADVMCRKMRMCTCRLHRSPHIGQTSSHSPVDCYTSIICACCPSQLTHAIDVSSNQSGQLHCNQALAQCLLKFEQLSPGADVAQQSCGAGWQCNCGACTPCMPPRCTEPHCSWNRQPEAALTPVA